MIHRNTMIATPDILYLADDESCKLIDTRTGEVRREIKPPMDVAGGTVWKWMALEKGILYAMVGGEESPIQGQPGKLKGGAGGWPWGTWPGYDYKDPKTSLAFGRTLLAIDVKTGRVQWRHAEDDYMDGRAVCMRGGKLYACAPKKFLLCLDTQTGKPVWKSAEPELLQAIALNGRGQSWTTSWLTSAYLRCNDDYLIFAGTQSSHLAAVQTKDGKVAWQRPDGNYQVLLRNEALFAFGPQGSASYRIDYATGKNLSQLLARRGCTRATGSIDSVFCRAREGTSRFDPTNDGLHFYQLMRPPCQDGVLISEGLLHWGPWMCVCNPLAGHICLSPAGALSDDFKPDERRQLVLGPGDPGQIQKADPALRISMSAEGIVRAEDSRTKKAVWKLYTGGEVKRQPVLWRDRIFVGANDGRVYAIEAASGRLLWRFQTAPEVRRIPVYGKLQSTWPVAGGVVVDDGVVYAAAGSTHYDGTHVYALDAVTGQVKWHNGTSGALNPTFRSGVSLQGPLGLTSKGTDKILFFEGGPGVGQARFDAATGKCLTKPPGGPTGK
jgi:outer membrane protein assembly factor BamB